MIPFKVKLTLLKELGGQMFLLTELTTTNSGQCWSFAYYFLQRNQNIFGMI